MIATASKTMSSLEHTDRSFAPNTPALSATEPAVPFVRASRGRLPSRSRQDDTPNAGRERGLFILGGGKATIGSGDIWRAAEDLDVSIEGGRRQCQGRRWRRMEGIGRDDLLRAFLDRDEFAKLRRFGDLALANRFGVWLKDAEDFVGYVRVAAEQPRAGLCEHAHHQRLHLLQPPTRLDQRRRGRSRRGAEALTDTAHHGRRITDDRARRGHQLSIAADQRIAGLGTPRLSADDQDATTDAAVPIADAAWLVAQRGTGVLHRARHHAHAVLQQRAIRRVVDICFYDRG